MKAINKNNWMVWAIAVLAVMNLATLTTVLYHRNKVDSQVAVVYPDQAKSGNASVKFSGRYFRDELNLSDEQMKSFSEFNPAFRQKVMAINRNLDIKRQEMLAEMSKKNCDTSRLNLLSDTIGWLHASLKKQTYLYYLNFKKICTDQQQEKLEQLFGEMFNNDFQRRQQGRGGPGGRRFGRRNYELKFLNFNFYVMKTKLIISLLAFAAITTLASGQNNDVNTRPLNGKGQGPAYVDANKNGVCDNYENQTTNNSAWKRSGDFNGCGSGRRQGHGQRGNWQGQRRGRNFVDADKNGVCDYREFPAKK